MMYKLLISTWLSRDVSTGSGVGTAISVSSIVVEFADERAAKVAEQIINEEVSGLLRRSALRLF